jgi:Ca2+-binding EF-hand superfamily protein
MFAARTRSFSKAIQASVSRKVQVATPSSHFKAWTIPQLSHFSTMTQGAASWDMGFLTHAEVAKRFEEFDRDGNGFITVAECKAAMERLEREISEGVVRESMWTWDRNSDGVVDYFEFMDYFLQTTPPTEKEAETKTFDSIEDLLEQCTIDQKAASVAGGLTRSAKVELINSFKTIDLDGDGFISPEELRVALQTMSPETATDELDARLKSTFEIADRNSDGLIDLYEFSSRVVQQGLYS